MGVCVVYRMVSITERTQEIGRLHTFINELSISVLLILEGITCLLAFNFFHPQYAGVFTIDYESMAFGPL